MKENTAFKDIGECMLQDSESGAAHALTLKEHTKLSAKPDVRCLRKSKVVTDREQCCWSNMKLYSESPLRRKLPEIPSPARLPQVLRAMFSGF